MDAKDPKIGKIFVILKIKLLGRNRDESMNNDQLSQDKAVINNFDDQKIHKDGK